MGSKSKSSLKPLVLHAVASGPNPWKVAILLEELGLPYERKIYEFAELKQEPYTDLNPNGRAPALEDPNTSLILAESGAIIQYLIDTYDTNHDLSYTTIPEKYKTSQWLFFQVSGQGPYFGQKAWFSMFHHEKLPSAEERYGNEIKRVLGVVNDYLKKQGTEYLVGDKCTYADLAWVTWDALVPMLVSEIDVEKEFPAYAAWNQRVTERPAVKKVLAEMAANAPKH